MRDDTLTDPLLAETHMRDDTLADPLLAGTHADLRAAQADVVNCKSFFFFAF